MISRSKLTMQDYQLSREQRRLVSSSLSNIILIVKIRADLCLDTFRYKILSLYDERLSHRNE